VYRLEWKNNLNMQINRLSNWLVVLVIVFHCGCGASNSDGPNKNPKFEGTVQEDLDPDKRQRQQVVSRFLKAIQEGVTTVNDLKFFLPDVEVKEPLPSVLDGGARLFSWDFNGPPIGEEVPVVVVIDDKESGRIDPTSERRQERVYLVSQNGSGYTISRKK
jgi:hypothetical protein